MRAVVVQAPGKLGVEAVPDPQPAAGQVVLAVAACGICGSDAELHRRALLPVGAVPGHELCGEVLEGAGALRPGDRVCALPVLSCGRCERCRSGLGAFCADARALGLGGAPGALAEYVAVAAHETVRLPPGVDDAAGALVEPLALALHAVNRAGLRRGERCLVLGGGPVGLAIALWARHLAAGGVVVSEPRAARRALAERLGATAVVDPSREELAAALPEAPDVVFETSGAPGLLREALERVRFRGRVVVAGRCVAPEAQDALPAVRHEATLCFVRGYEKDDFQYAVDALDRGRVDPSPLVTERVPLEAVPDAVGALGRGDGACKVVASPRW